MAVVQISINTSPAPNAPLPIHSQPSREEMDGGHVRFDLKTRFSFAATRCACLRPATNKFPPRSLRLSSSLIVTRMWMLFLANISRSHRPDRLASCLRRREC